MNNDAKPMTDNAPIPTGSKTKIPKGWSYPVGAEILSQVLCGIPQYDYIYLRFLWANPSSKWMSKDESRIHLLNVSYTNPQHTAMERNWDIDIIAIRSQQKALVRQLLVEEILPYMRSWIIAERPPLWHERWKAVNAYYNLDTEKVQYYESGGQ